MPDKLPLKVRTYPNAGVAIDAPRHVDRNVRVRIVRGHSAIAVKIARIETVVERQLRKELVGKRGECPRRVVARKHPQIPFSACLDRLAVRQDVHAVSKLRRARDGLF
jgi:hypothetical protein